MVKNFFFRFLQCEVNNKGNSVFFYFYFCLLKKRNEHKIRFPISLLDYYRNYIANYYGVLLLLCGFVLIRWGPFFSFRFDNVLILDY